MRIALVNGFWGQNIGNAFFNIGGESLLNSAFPDQKVLKVQDQSAYWTFRNEAKGSFNEAFDLLGSLDVDLLVLQGPLFTRNFANIWKLTLSKLQRRGVQWAALGSAFRQYTNEEVAVFDDVVSSVPPLFVSTRDDTSFEMIERTGLVKRLHAGIDSAFMMNREIEVPSLVGGPFVALNFDHFPEPEFVPDPEGVLLLGGQRFSLRFSGTSWRLATKGKAQAYLGQMLLGRQKFTKLGDATVVRPEHRTNPHLPMKIYRNANALASDEPYSYAALYANVEVTLADRVHACVLTLSYGGAAMLFNPTTRRSALLNKVVDGDITEAPCRLVPGLVDAQFEQTVEFISAAGKDL